MRIVENSQDTDPEDDFVDILEDDNPNPPKQTPAPLTSLSLAITINNSAIDPTKCPICYNPLISQKLFKGTPNVCTLTNCGHNYCKQCMFTYFSLCIKEKNLPIKCPNTLCKKEVGFTDIQNELPIEYVNNFERFQFEKVIQQNPEIYSCCPTPDCGYYFMWTLGDDPHFRCEKCKKRYCLTCKVDYHSDRSCLQFQRWARDNGMSDQLFNIFVTGQKFKQCLKCKTWVEKINGCDTIYCTCGHNFCYRCGTNICICWAHPPETVANAFAFLQNNNHDDDDEDDMEEDD